MIVVNGNTLRQIWLGIIKIGEVYVKDIKVFPDQGWVYTFSISPSSYNVDAMGGSITYQISSRKQLIIGEDVQGQPEDLAFSLTSTDLPEGFTFDEENKTITVSENQSLSSRTGSITFTQDESNKILIFNINQSAGYYTYSNITITSASASNDIPASGGSVNSGTVNYSQTYGWNGRTSGVGTVTSGASIVFNNTVSANSKGTVLSDRTKAGDLSYTVTLNGKTLTSTITVYQAANTATYGEITITGGSVSDIPAGGGSVSSAGCRASQYTKYTSGSEGTTSVTVTYNTVRASSLYSTEKERSFIGTLTATASAHGYTATKDFDVYQEANVLYNTIYGSLTIDSVSAADIPASGGTVSTASVEYHKANYDYFTSGYIRTWGRVTSGATVTYGDPVTAPSLGTTVKDRTLIGRLYVYVELDGETDSDYDFVYQDENKQYDDGTNTEWGSTTWNDLSISADKSSLPYSGGTVTLSPTSNSGTQSGTIHYKYRYDSGATSSSDVSTSRSASESVSYSTTVGSVSSNKVTVGENPGTSRTITITGKGNTSGKTDTVTISQADGIIYYNEYVFTASKSSLSFANTGGSDTFVITSYRTGSRLDGSGAVTESVDWSGNITSGSGYSASPTSGGNQSTVTISKSENTSTSSSSGHYKATQSISGKTIELDFSQAAAVYEFKIKKSEDPETAFTTAISYDWPADTSSSYQVRITIKSTRNGSNIGYKVSTNVDWIILNSTTSLNFTVNDNTGSARTGVITMTQDGSGLTTTITFYQAEGRTQITQYQYQFDVDSNSTSTSSAVAAKTIGVTSKRRAITYYNDGELISTGSWEDYNSVSVTHDFDGADSWFAGNYASGSLGVIITENTTYSSRTGSIILTQSQTNVCTLSGYSSDLNMQIIIITQAGKYLTVTVTRGTSGNINSVTDPPNPLREGEHISMNMGTVSNNLTFQCPITAVGQNAYIYFDVTCPIGFTSCQLSGTGSANGAYIPITNGYQIYLESTDGSKQDCTFTLQPATSELGAFTVYVHLV